MTRSLDQPEEREALRDRFEALWRAHGPALQRLSRASESDPSRAADLCQDICAALWSALGRFEGRSTLRTWVFSVAHNTAISHVTRARRDPTELHSIEALEALAPDDAPDAEGAVDHQRTLQRLEALLHVMRPADRSLVTLWLEGFTPQELAEVSGLSANNVRVKLHRIKALLRKRLTMELPDDA